MIKGDLDNCAGIIILSKQVIYMKIAHCIN